MAKKDWTHEIYEEDTIKKGTLGKTGYSYTNTPTQNEKAVRKGLKMYGYKKLMHKLNFVANVNKHRPHIREPARRAIRYLETLKPTGEK